MQIQSAETDCNHVLTISVADKYALDYFFFFVCRPSAAAADDEVVT